MATRVLPVTAMQNPVFLAKVGRAMREAINNCAAWGNGHGKAYVANRKGHNVLRVSYHAKGEFVFYGDQARNVTPAVIRTLRQFGKIEDAQ